jgi:O-antigen/teichoic acid export membrane protein
MGFPGRRRQPHGGGDSEVASIEPIDPALAEEASELAPFEGRFPGMTGGLREHAARGTLINAAFRVSLAFLSLLQRILVAAFLTPEELGIWGIVLITLITLLFIKNVGISDKFIQQSEPDQELAFQKAFTIELVLTLVFVAIAAALLPVFAVAYDQWSIVVPGLILLLAAIGNSFQAPTWIFYRQMQFVRQRTLEAVNPIVTFVLTMGLAIAGAGYWSLIFGAVVGSLAGGVVALRASPYRIRFRMDRGTVREYFQFSWPLVAAQIGVVVVAQGSMLIGARTVGISGVGAIALASSITAFSTGVSALVTQTLYPAICAVRDRTDLLLESFVKSNRLALMWGVPFGLGVTLIAPDLVRFVIGERWLPAVFILQMFGIMVAIDQLGFNWAAFLRARNHTKPLAIVGLVTTVAFFAIPVPLLIAGGLKGYAIGMVGMAIVGLAARVYFLGRLFSDFTMFWHASRAITPSIPPLAIVLGMRLLEPGDRALGIAVAELVVYVVATISFTIVFERTLLREILGYLRKSGQGERRTEGTPLATGESSVA